MSFTHLLLLSTVPYTLPVWWCSRVLLEPRIASTNTSQALTEVHEIAPQSASAGESESEPQMAHIEIQHVIYLQRHTLGCIFGTGQKYLLHYLIRAGFNPQVYYCNAAYVCTGHPQRTTGEDRREVPSGGSWVVHWYVGIAHSINPWEHLLSNHLAFLPGPESSIINQRRNAAQEAILSKVLYMGRDDTLCQATCKMC